MDSEKLAVGNVIRRKPMILRRTILIALFAFLSGCMGIRTVELDRKKDFILVLEKDSRQWPSTVFRRLKVQYHGLDVPIEFQVWTSPPEFKTTPYFGAGALEEGTPVYLYAVKGDQPYGQAFNRYKLEVLNGKVSAIFVGTVKYEGPYFGTAKSHLGITPEKYY